MTDIELADFTVTLKMARKTGSIADEVEHRTFTVTGPARHAKHAEAIAFGLGHGINEATGYAWKFCGGSDSVTVTPASGADEVDELTVALAKSREQAATNANEVGNLTAENARVRQQRDAHAAVVEAAKAWRFSGDTASGHREAIAALNAAVDALPKAEATR